MSIPTNKPTSALLGSDADSGFLGALSTQPAGLSDDEFFALLEQMGRAAADGTLEEPAFLEMYWKALAYPDFRRFAEPFLMTAQARGWDVSSVDPEGAKMLAGGSDSSGALPEDEDELDPELVDEPVVKTKKLEDAPDPEDVQVTPPHLQPHDIDIPEEPETVRVITRVFNRATGQMEEKDLGEMLLVPTGCEAPERVSPYQTTVTLRSALPRDKQLDANLYAAYQTNGWASRRWIQQRLDEDIDADEVDAEIADGLPLLLELQGKGAAGVGQTNGPGDNNGAPLPPGPGPGRGNLNTPGDNMGGM
jgi:hypothetical protein